MHASRRRWLAVVAAVLVAAATVPEAPAGALPDVLSPQNWNSAVVGPQRDGAAGRPAAAANTVRVSTLEQLRAAIAEARPGTVIEIQPGTYELPDANIRITRPGRRDRPIVLRAPALGTVTLKSARQEALHVLAPYWTFENLVIEGVCADDSDCEHAFHVVGDAVGTVIQDNWIADFNAAIKVNGLAGRYPDGGVIRRNALVNTRPRNTDRPVALLDFVSASRWRVQQNLIADFAKTGGDRTSYGAFFKGAGEDTLFERNLVRCEWRHGGDLRIGFSFGADGTARKHCRDGNCEAEHRGGAVRNNVVMNCPNHAGIYLSRSAGGVIHNNALIATQGILVRAPAGPAAIVNNIVDGTIRGDAGGAFAAEGNLVGATDAGPGGAAGTDIYVNPQHGDFRLKAPSAVAGRGKPLDSGGVDFCGHTYGTAARDIGPVQRAEGGCTAFSP